MIYMKLKRHMCMAGSVRMIFNVAQLCCTFPFSVVLINLFIYVYLLLLFVCFFCSINFDVNLAFTALVDF